MTRLKTKLKKNHSIAKKGCVLAFFISVVWFVNITYQWGMASAWYFNASYQLSDWSKAGKITDEQSYIDAITAINKAIANNPNHPNYFQAKGRIVTWGINADYEATPELTTYTGGTLLSVKQLYLKSLKLRNSWYEVWLDVARVNYQLQGYTVETNGYIEKANFYGKYQQETTITTLTMLMQSWQSLSPENIELFYTQLDIALSQKRLQHQVFKIAKNNNLTSLLCIQIKYNKKHVLLKNTWLEKRYCKV